LLATTHQFLFSQNVKQVEYGHFKRRDQGDNSDRSDNRDRGGFGDRNDNRDRGGFRERSDNRDRGGFGGGGGFRGGSDNRGGGGFRDRGDNRDRGGFRDRGDNRGGGGGGFRDREGDQEESVFSKRVRAGKRRTYFLDVRKTRGDDFFITITESTRREDGYGYKRHKIFLYKEDFNRFVASLNEVVEHVKTTLMPDFDYEEFDRRQAEWEAQNREGADTENEGDFVDSEDDLNDATDHLPEDKPGKKEMPAKDEDDIVW
jgi:hypothetical protein